MSDWPLLSLVIFLPLAGAAFIMLIRGEPEVVAQNARSVALWTATITFLLSLLIWANFDSARADFQLVEQAEWLAGFNINYHVGIDGISLFLVLLSTLTTLICIVISWESVQVRVKEYMVAFLVMETFMVGVFCSLDFVLFYLFFEGTLIPMFLIIGIWGGPRRIYSAFKFFLYTLLGSVLFFIAILVMYLQEGTTDIPTLMAAEYAPELQFWLWLAMFASFAVKVPMWPFHTWLPDAHVEAPTAGSVILAGVLLKLGGYGFIRYNLALYPDAAQAYAPLIVILSIIAIIYGAIVAMVQPDLKKLVAYSSVSHMGFVTLGIFIFQPQAMDGAILQMVNHGLITGALFLLVGVIYERTHDRTIAKMGGLAGLTPVYAAVFGFFVLASAGLPGLSGFVGEFLALLGTFAVNPLAAGMAALVMILGAAYLLWMYQRVVFGEPSAFLLGIRSHLTDMTPTEILTLAPLGALVVVFGLFPGILLDLIRGSVESTLEAVGHGSAIAVDPLIPAVGLGIVVAAVVVQLASVVFGGGGAGEEPAGEAPAPEGAS
jgi:NADH-quinone oxidoreductase subunit M